MNNMSQHVQQLGREQAPPATFTLTDEQRLQRFLILGSDGGTYYATERALTIENAECVKRLVEPVATDNYTAAGKRVARALQVVKTIVEVSDSGRAPKNDAALLALAIVVKYGHPVVREAALKELPRVARIGTHLFHFLDYAKALRVGWGRSFRKAIANWYTDKSEKDLAYSLIKYQSRDGWSNRDALRLSHPTPRDEVQQALFHWVTKGEGEGAKWDGSKHQGLAQVAAFEALKKVNNVESAVKLIHDFDLPRETIPTQFLNSPEVWATLLPTMKMEATLRNLAKMTAIGLLKPLSEAEAIVVNRLGDADAIKRARLHPIKVLNALLVYRSGKGDKGSLTWSPNQRIVQALEAAFYLAFGSVEPTNKRILKALDVSGSMSHTGCAGAPNISPRVGSALMAMVSARVEPRHAFMAFSGGFVPLHINSAMSLQEIVRSITGLRFDSTDCSLPMIWAAHHRIEVDSFEIYTDSETNSHTISPVEALRRYRDKMGIDAKLVVVGMTASEKSIADPNNGNCLDVVGFDLATPEIISDFIRG